MRLRLIIPALFHFADTAPLPRALQMLRFATRTLAAGDWPEARLCRLFGLDDQPIAELTLALDHAATDSKAGWLRADPVHLAVAQNSMSVLAGETLHIEADEATALAATLNQLLQQDGMHLHAAQPQRWYLQLPTATATQFMPLPLAMGRPLPAQTMTGADAAQWKRRVAEIQMSLHQHPVNEMREQRGLPAINHLWLWGEGKPAALQPPSARLWGDNIVLCALARRSGTPLQALPSTFARWREKADGDEHILFIDTLQNCADAANPAAWGDALVGLSKDWLEPLLKAGLQQLVIEIPSVEQTLIYSLGRWDRCFFWKNTHVGH